MSWAGIASNQCVSLNNLQDAVDTSVFTLKSTIPAGLKQITKAEANDYVNIDVSYAPYAAKSSNQLVVKSDLVAATPVTFTEYRAYGYDENGVRIDACPLNNLTESPQTVYATTSNPFAVTQFYNTADDNDPWDNLPGDGYAVSFSTAADTSTRYAGFGTTTGAISSVIAC